MSHVAQAPDPAPVQDPDDDDGSRSATIDDVRSIVDDAVERLTSVFNAEDVGPADTPDPDGVVPDDDSRLTPAQIEATVEAAVRKALTKAQPKKAPPKPSRAPAPEPEPVSPTSLTTRLRKWMWES